MRSFVAVLSLLQLACAFTPLRPSSRLHGSRIPQSVTSAVAVEPSEAVKKDEISADDPLHVIIAGAGVGGLALAHALRTGSDSRVRVTVCERTQSFRKFGGPIQLASNALQTLKVMDTMLYQDIEAAATWTGNRTNGIKDGIRDEWYAKFDLGSPAEIRGMPYTCVVERPELQQIFLDRVGDCVLTGKGVDGYAVDEHPGGINGVTVRLQDGETITGDVLVGADGIWSQVRATLRDEPAKGEGSGVAYSGYTVFAGELNYDSPDVKEVGYKVYIGPKQYFVITDIGNGRYQWYAFLAREPNSAETEDRPNGNVPYLKDLFEGWSQDIHSILQATQEHEVEQRDLYDRPPSVLKSWGEKNVVLLGDAVHAMMPNLGQGGCQAIEDAKVIAEELHGISKRSEVESALRRYVGRRRFRSAAVQGLSRFASDIIIRGFDTPLKVKLSPSFSVENFNYAGVVTKLLQPLLPIFFSIQFNFLYAGYSNEPLALEPIRDFFVLTPSLVAGGLAVDALLGGEAFESLSALFSEVMDAIEL